MAEPGSEQQHDRSLRPWQQPTVGSWLTLHAAAALRYDLASMRAEYATVDRVVGPDSRNFLANDGTWSAIPLIERDPHAADGTLRAGSPMPALHHMPSVNLLLEGSEWTVLSCYILRQPPRGILPWHFDNQGLHLVDCRLLIPIHAPEGAVTRIGHDVAAYPAGVAWTADFSFPHQVENPGEAERIVLAVDVRVGLEIRQLLPAALADAAPLRHALSQQARNRLLHWRASQRS